VQKHSQVWVCVRTHACLHMCLRVVGGASCTNIYNHYQDIPMPFAITHTMLPCATQRRGQTAAAPPAATDQSLEQHCYSVGILCLRLQVFVMHSGYSATHHAPYYWLFLRRLPPTYCLPRVRHRHFVSRFVTTHLERHSGLGTGGRTDGRLSTQGCLSYYYILNRCAGR